MLLLSQSPGGALSATATRRPSASFTFTTPKTPLFSNRKPKFITQKSPSKPLVITHAKADDVVETKQQPPAFETVFVAPENVPLEGVIQFEKPSNDFSSKLNKWGRVALLAGGDVLALVLFAAIGRFSHGFPVLDVETLRTADPFVAGWFLSAYFLGGYGEDGRGMNGQSKAVISAAKSWALGIPLGLTIRAALLGHIPPYQFIFVTMGSTAVLLIGWRALLFSFLATRNSKKNDMYRRGSPFELFELLTSLIRRW